MADSNATTWVDHRKQELLVAGLDRALSMDPDERIVRGQLQRQRAVNFWSRGASLKSWRGLLGI